MSGPVGPNGCQSGGFDYGPPIGVVMCDGTPVATVTARVGHEHRQCDLHARCAERIGLKVVRDQMPETTEGES